MVTMQMRITAMFLSFLTCALLIFLTLHISHNLLTISRPPLPEPLVYPGVEEHQGAVGEDAGAHQAEHVHVVPNGHTYI